MFWHGMASFLVNIYRRIFSRIKQRSLNNIWIPSLKKAGIKYRNPYQTRYGAQQDILQYIAVLYNNQRLHSYLNYKSPNQYEAEAAKLTKAA